MGTKEKQIYDLVNSHIIGVDEVTKIKQTIDCFWDCFLNSKIADDTEVRKRTYYHYLELSHFFENLEQLTVK